jgi:outer membrane lipoprotein SlyB
MEDKMEAQKTRLHPLVAGAAAAVIVAAGVAVAAITGVLPGSKAEMAPTPEAKSAQPAKTHVASTQTAQHKPVPVCHDCGVIVEVKEVDVLGKGTGMGAVAGGVGGAVIGHQIGDNRAGTAVGAVVGAVAGHQIERKAREHKKYEITVRMNDGSVRSLSDESGTPVALRSGDKVRVSKEGVIRPI